MIDAQTAYNYPGEIKAWKETSLSFRVDGPLVDVAKKPGERVFQKELLMQLDPRDYRDRIRILEAELDGALARANKASQDFTRAKQLFAKNVIAKADYDLARSNAASQNASVKNIRAQLSVAQHQLKDTSLRAPYDGIVTAQLVENHEMIRAGQIVMRMHDISTLEISTNIPENDIGQLLLQKGSKAVLTVPSLSSRLFTAALKEWSTEADKTTRTYNVTFSLPAPPDNSLLPGMTAEITLRNLKTRKPVMTVPLDAVTADSEGNSIIWVYDEKSGKVASKKVVTAEMYDDDRIIVNAGLEGNELIITGGVHFLVEGLQVEPLKPSTVDTLKPEYTKGQESAL
jgi:RND family efflux transporter MFP subunit